MKKKEYKPTKKNKQLLKKYIIKTEKTDGKRKAN